MVAGVSPAVLVTPSVQAYVDDSGQWLKLRDRNTGKVKAIGIPSRTHAGRYHMVTPHSCSCPAGQWRTAPCAHRAALQLKLRDTFKPGRMPAVERED